MTTESETRIPYSDLRLVAVRCKKCGAETTVDTTNEVQARAWAEGYVFTCSICQTNHGDAVKAAIYHIREAVRSAQASGAVIVLRIPTERLGAQEKA